MFGTSESSQDVLERERREAFELLSALVNENYDVGRRSFGASLKPELRRRTYGGFDESRLQFASFRRFLEAAREVGVIDVHLAPKGPDLEATPPGRPPVTAAPTRVTRSRRLRRDLWEAFVNWDGGWVRVYDKQNERAVRFPKEPVPLEPAESADLREAVTAAPDRFVPIEPISFERQREWMLEFAASVPDPVVKSALELALTSERPVRDFTQALQSRPDVRKQWTTHRLVLVEAVARAWATAAGLDIEIHQPRDTDDEHDKPAASSEAKGTDRVLALRDVLHGAIDRMPESELLQIRLPVGYIVER